MTEQGKQKTWFKAPDGTKGLNALVAKEAGVTSGTVANVFKRPEVVIPETRQRVLDAVAKLEYVVNELPTMKKCTACKSVKPPEDFYNGHKTKKQRNATNKKYPHSRCKECEHKKNKIYHKENRAKVSERQVMTHRRKKYGVSEEEYKNMVLSQNNICAICNKPSHKTLHVDHDHITGKVRGLLCSSCNMGIGMFQDDIDILNNAIKYLS
jgi:hypothetical protein